MYAIHLGVWIFGEVGVEIKFGQKTACLDMSTVDKKSQVSTIGRDLAAIWNIQIFGYLNI
jgi:hypothetical protein